MQNSISHWQRILLQEVEEKQLSPKQQKIAKLDPPADKIDAGDFKKLRGGAKIKEGEDSTWPEEVLSYHGDMKFVKQKISSDGATYQIVDLENDNKPMGRYAFRSAKTLKDFANDYIKPKGGRQSSQFEAASIEMDPYGEDPNLDIKADEDIPELGMTEEQDHEVSMANNSLESIVKAAMELKAKLGDNEKDIPAWIQDHITNAANFISQAADNYHEYGGEEKPEEETEDSLTAIMEKIIKNGRK